MTLYAADHLANPIRPVRGYRLRRGGPDCVLSDPDCGAIAATAQGCRPTHGACVAVRDFCALSGKGFAQLARRPLRGRMQSRELCRWDRAYSRIAGPFHLPGSTPGARLALRRPYHSKDGLCIREPWGRHSCRAIRSPIDQRCRGRRICRDFP